MKTLLLAGIALLATTVAWAWPFAPAAIADNRVPDIFQGHWQQDSIEVLNVEPTQMVESLYNCSIKNVKQVHDLAGGQTYQIDMVCQTESLEHGLQPPERIRSLWAIRKMPFGRKTPPRDVLIIASWPNTIENVSKNVGEGRSEREGLITRQHRGCNHRTSDG